MGTGIISKLKAQQGSHSQTEDMRTGLVSWLEIARGSSHSHPKEMSSTDLKHSKVQQLLTPWRDKDSVISKPETWLGATTHKLEGQRQAFSAGLIVARHSGHSHPRGSRRGIVSMLKTK